MVRKFFPYGDYGEEVTQGLEWKACWQHDDSHVLDFPHTQAWSERHIVYLRDYVRGRPSTWVVG